jgi:hypothetical protein
MLALSVADLALRRSTTYTSDNRALDRSAKRSMLSSVNKHPRARRAEGSRPPTRPPQPHPDEGRPTRRMPFEQLRALVVSLLEPDSDADAAADNEFDTQPTTHRPSQSNLSRVSTLDQVIASLPKP